MLDDFRKSTVSYWEKRRLIYNLLLLPSALLGWNLSADFTYSIDDRIPASTGDPFVIRSVLYLLLLANVCYSMVYVLEVFMMSEKRKPFWPRGGRTVVFGIGCALGMLLASSSAFHLQTAACGPWLQPGYQGEGAEPLQETSAKVPPASAEPEARRP